MNTEEKEIFFSETVFKRGNKILRTVSDIVSEIKIIEVLNKLGYFKKNTVPTSVYSSEEKLLEHQLIKGIVHSEEYTESMAFDSVELALDMSVELLNYNIYGWDLLPHNYTFNNGKWLLYDFGALSLKPYNLKTEIRGLFKIVFSAFELSKLVKRSNLKQLYLNRIKCSDLVTMIPFKNWLKYFLKLNFCLFLLNTRQYKRMYCYLQKVLNEYKKPKQVYNFELLQNEIDLFELLSKEISTCGVSELFSAGEISAKFMLAGLKDKHKTIYVDNYDLCDEIYNYIVKNKLDGITIGALFPLEDNDVIPENINNRAIYDNYAKKRFNCDCAICLDDVDLSFIKNISDFANKLLIIKTKDKANAARLLSELYSDVKDLEINNSAIIIAKNNKKNFKYNLTYKSYANFNRGKDSEIQTKMIREILKINKTSSL